MRADLLFYRVVRTLVVVFDRLFWRVSVEGREHVPDGPFVLAPVHRSNVDTPLVAAVTARRLRYMGKDAMWRYRPAAWLFTALGGFPVRRGTVDREALRRCVAVIEGGEPLVVFPEGGRQSGPTVRPLFEGAAYVAIRTGVPVLPVGVGGSERAMPKGSRWLRPVKVHLVVGPPLWPPPAGPSGRVSRRDVRELTDRLHRELQRLFDAAQARVGGSPGG